ncbi:MAG: 1-hydroxycarotenoid 3,4-desaturase CrtD [Rhodothalassiaceae bacterium]
MTRSRTLSVIIIGAGMGGLTAAVRLAAAGYRVTVLEKEARPGGKVRQLQVGGRGVDSGPTVFTMRRVFDGLFEQIGERLDDHLTLVPADRLARHVWHRSEILDLYADVDRSADAIAAFAGAREADGYRRFLAKARQTLALLEPRFMCQANPSKLGVLLSLSVPQLIAVTPKHSLWGAVSRYFKDPRLRQLFGRYATYTGSSPFQASETLMLIAQVEQQGVWMVEGGMIRLPQMLAGLADRFGAEIRTGCGAAEITTANGRVSGVVTEAGEHLAADAVIANVDANALASGRFGAAAARVVRPVPASQRSLSVLAYALSGRAHGLDLHRHTVFFSRDYRAEFRSLFGQRQLASEPSIYLCAQDRGEDGIAPADRSERFLALINAPATGDRNAFGPDVTDQWQRHLSERLAACGLDLTIEQAQVTTPAGFDTLFPATGGALYGRATHGTFASFARPNLRTRLPGLYLAGGSVHPSAGVPMAALSGRMAAECVMTD